MRTHSEETGPNVSLGAWASLAGAELAVPPDYVSGAYLRGQTSVGVTYGYFNTF